MEYRSYGLRIILAGLRARIFIVLSSQQGLANTARIRVRHGRKHCPGNRSAKSLGSTRGSVWRPEFGMDLRIDARSPLAATIQQFVQVVARPTIVEYYQQCILF